MALMIIFIFNFQKVIILVECDELFQHPNPPDPNNYYLHFLQVHKHGLGRCEWWRWHEIENSVHSSECLQWCGREHPASDTASSTTQVSTALYFSQYSHFMYNIWTQYLIKKKKSNDTHFCLWGDSACCHAYSVDAAAGVLMDFNVRFLLSHLHVTCGVEKIQHLLII